MYIELKDTTGVHNRLGEYNSYTTAYQGMIEYCVSVWLCKESDLFTKKDIENSDGNHDVYRVSCNTGGRRSKKFVLKINS